MVIGMNHELFSGNFMEHVLFQLLFAQIHRVIAVNFEFIFEEQSK
jgi:hypothetical protein